MFARWFAKNSIHGLYEARHVRMKIRTSIHRKGIVFRKFFQTFGKLVSSRHACPIYQKRNYANLEAQCSFDFSSNPIPFTTDPRLPIAPSSEPEWADNDKQDVCIVQLPVNEIT